MKFTLKNLKYQVSFPTIRGNEKEEVFETKEKYFEANFPGEEVKRPIVSCYIKNSETKEILSITKAECSNKDRFVKVKGEKIALGRGLLKLGFNKSERKEIWDQYLTSSAPRRKCINTSTLETALV